MILPPRVAAIIDRARKRDAKSKHASELFALYDLAASQSMRLFWNAADAAARDHDLLHLWVIWVNAGGPMPAETTAQRRKRRTAVADVVAQLRSELAKEPMASKILRDATLATLEEELRSDALAMTIYSIKDSAVPAHLSRASARQTYFARRLSGWFLEHTGRPHDNEVTEAISARLGYCEIDVPKARTKVEVSLQK